MTNRGNTGIHVLYPVLWAKRMFSEAAASSAFRAFLSARGNWQNSVAMLLSIVGYLAIAWLGTSAAATWQHLDLSNCADLILKIIKP